MLIFYIFRMNKPQDIVPNIEIEEEVEKILDKKIVMGKVYYLLKWKGCTDEQNTWEPALNLNCDRLLRKFKKKMKHKLKKLKYKEKKLMKKNEKRLKKVQPTKHKTTSKSSIIDDEEHKKSENYYLNNLSRPDDANPMQISKLSLNVDEVGEENKERQSSTADNRNKNEDNKGTEKENDKNKIDLERENKTKNNNETNLDRENITEDNSETDSETDSVTDIEYETESEDYETLDFLFINNVKASYPDRIPEKCISLTLFKEKYLFLIKWEGYDDYIYITYKDARKVYPQIVIKYYEDILDWNIWMGKY